MFLVWPKAKISSNGFVMSTIQEEIDELDRVAMIDQNGEYKGTCV